MRRWIGLTAVTAALSYLPTGDTVAAEQRPPFLTMEDQRRCIDQDETCFKWIYQKALIARIVQQVLTERGFEQKTAFFIARDWDAFRYDIETGAKILPKPPMQMTAADAVEFAGQIPQCFADMAASTCQVRFAMEYGCNLQRDYVAACRRSFSSVKTKFPRMLADGKTFMSWYDAEYNFYNGIACLFGPNGSDIAVFDAGPAATVTKLKFDAGAEGVKLAALARATPAATPVPAAPAVTPAPACKAVVRTSHWRVNDEFRAEGQDLPGLLDVAGLNIGDDLQRLRRKGDPPVPRDAGASSPATRSIVYDDLADGWLGMELGRIEDIGPADATLPRSVVRYVAPDGPASQAGIQKGDSILRIGGRAVDDAMYLGLHVTEAPVGKPMNVVYERGGKRTTVVLTAIDIEEAERRNDAAALRYLGDFYANQRAYNAAAEPARVPNHYLRAAELGDTGAMARLASTYRNSDKGGDRAEARKWYEKAANAGHVPSMRRLADMHSGGEGGPKDFARAREWLEKGAAAGDIDQMYEIVRLYRDEGPGKLPDQRKWLETLVAAPANTIASDQRPILEQAKFDLAVIKLHGLGGPKDLVAGRALLEQAAAAGSVAQAPYTLGIFLMTPQGGQDTVKARQWFERGAKGPNADPNAMWALGMSYKDGVGGAANPAEARKWLKRAAELGHKEAAKDLVAPARPAARPSPAAKRGGAVPPP